MKNTRKKAVIEKHKKHVKDNGSHGVQVALLTDRINELQSHLETHKKDQSSRRGLLVMVGKRRKLLNYLHMSNQEEYEGLLAKLNLRK